jgi:hypothetical protein
MARQSVFYTSDHPRVTASARVQPATNALSSRSPQTMASTSQPPKGRDVVLPTLDVFIQALNITKDACGVPPAQIALGSACTLLTMIRVSFLLLREDVPLTQVYLGHDGQL